MMRTVLLLCSLVAGILMTGCERKMEQEPVFSELRLHRWLSLDGGETLVIRHVGTEWSAVLLGDGDRFSCLYQKPVKPKSDWQHVWDQIEQRMEKLPDGYKGEYVVEDGNGFDVEFTNEEKLKRLSIPHPESQSSPIGKQILEVSDLLGREFDTPIFIGEYSRSEAGDYLIENCKNFRK